MDAQLKAKWVTALRSGDYQQTKNTLQDRIGFCCLGVLNEVRGAIQSYNNLPRLVGNWEVLARMNDEQGKSFAEIADYIEGNL